MNVERKLLHVFMQTLPNLSSTLNVHIQFHLSVIAHNTDFITDTIPVVSMTEKVKIICGRQMMMIYKF